MRELLEELQGSLAGCMLRDQRQLRSLLRRARERLRERRPADRLLEQAMALVEHSTSARQRRLETVPRPLSYPEELPVCQIRGEIIEAIRAHQVLVLVGHTGSGKSTQLPKLCLEAGRGVGGLVGHTQPRRIAARSVSARVAQELGSTVGDLVGFKVRFTDRVSDRTLVKLLTDGMLLAEIQGDRHLEAYDTIIVDEAHERSLNIDFLLGYLTTLLRRRPDLKLIITSATIDPQRFASHFGGAPVLQAEGRTYPVEVHYRPLGEGGRSEERDQLEGVLEAVEELRDTEGDILAFFATEREIRQTAKALRRERSRGTEILPLYARLSAPEQDRVFLPHEGRRIVLATNVAETSLTVPGIRHVIDTGRARISRFGLRGGVQRLPIEPISRASADQRLGRCGRLGPGLCIRLYAEEDYRSRAAYTQPEILRTSLAAVILQMLALQLGTVEEFPFVDPPDRRQIAEGYRLLVELGAVDEEHRITALGRQLARLPVDPRLGRMILQGAREGCLREMLIIASALSIQDPRERPLEQRDAADAMHRRFYREGSDFLAFLELWDWFHRQQRQLSRGELRRTCREGFLSLARLWEWRDLHHQLGQIAGELGLPPERGRAASPVQVHRAVLAGLLGQIGSHRPGEGYQGARGRQLHIHPGSFLFGNAPAWIMAAELVETTRLYARVCASIDPVWAEELGAHLVRRAHSDPHWDEERAQVTAYEQVTLYGLVLSSGRRVHYGAIDPDESRRTFIRHALVRGEYRTRAPFREHNQALISRALELEARQRRRSVLVDEHLLFHLYDLRLPEGIVSGTTFERWWSEGEEQEPRRLHLTWEELTRPEAEEVSQVDFPDVLEVGDLRLPLEYHFEPGHPEDGVTATVPAAALGRLRPADLEHLVPGLLEEKVTALLRGLPKDLRRQLVPVPEVVSQILPRVTPRRQPLMRALEEALLELRGVRIPVEAWQPATLPPHLRLRLRVVDSSGEVLGAGRDLEALQAELAGAARAHLPRVAGFEREGLRSWQEVGELPERVALGRSELQQWGYPALEDQGEAVALRVAESPERAREMTTGGLRRLLLLELEESGRHLVRRWGQKPELRRDQGALGTGAELREEMLLATAGGVLSRHGEEVRTGEGFRVLVARGREELVALGEAVGQMAATILGRRREILGLLEGDRSPVRAPAHADIREQLDHLVSRGFIAGTPPGWLQHLPRYLHAILRRLEKLRRAPDKDERWMAQVRPFWQAYLERAEIHRQRGVQDLALERYRWMVEELRVSLFAQELGTAFPISPRRLQDQWRHIR